MHSLLEPPRVATVAISNWSLDASKNNRAINLSRTEPNEEDLKESALSIAKNGSMIFKNLYLSNLVKWYFAYMKR
jgi:hypothetical protein